MLLVAFVLIILVTRKYVSRICLKLPKYWLGNMFMVMGDSLMELRIIGKTNILFARILKVEKYR